MLNDITNNLASSLLNSSSSSQNVAKVTNAIKNAYGAEKTNNLVDESNISEEAIAKYEAEKEISYYKKLLNQMMSEDENDYSSQILEIINKVQNGEYEIDNKELAQSILMDEDAKDLLL